MLSSRVIIEEFLPRLRLLVILKSSSGRTSSYVHLPLRAYLCERWSVPLQNDNNAQANNKWLCIKSAEMRDRRRKYRKTGSQRPVYRPACESLCHPSQPTGKSSQKSIYSVQLSLCTTFIYFRVPTTKSRGTVNVEDKHVEDLIADRWLKLTDKKDNDDVEILLIVGAQFEICPVNRDATKWSLTVIIIEWLWWKINPVTTEMIRRARIG